MCKRASVSPLCPALIHAKLVYFLAMITARIGAGSPSMVLL